MEEEILFVVRQQNCKHFKHRRNKERVFDILNGFELVTVKCSNCHKTLAITIKKMC